MILLIDGGLRKIDSAQNKVAIIMLQVITQPARPNLLLRTCILTAKYLT